MPAQQSDTPLRPGILLVDKPEEITSHGVVARIRRAAGTRKVGHAGTLDPMATGLLVTGIGSATRLLTHFVGLDKEYTATIRLGRATTTDDREGEPIGDFRDAGSIDDDAIAAAVGDLTGDILQRPSSVSAIKVDGQRSYARVRAGETVELPSRPVTVSEFTVLSRSEAEGVDGGVDLEVRVVCSSGTYIRALARDLGEALDVGGHLTALRRTRVGPFVVDDARPLAAFDEPGSARPLIVPAGLAATRLFRAVALDAGQAIDLGNGKKIPVAASDSEVPVAAIGPEGSLVALVTVTRGIARVVTGFPKED